MIRLVWGAGHGSTGKASFDAALAEANIHQYNLRLLSSVIPAGVEIDATGTAPEFGAVGSALDVVVARQTSPPGTRASAGLAWVRGEDTTGIFYEAADHDPETVEKRLETGIEEGCSLREIDGDPSTRILTATATPESYTTAVVAAVYGEPESLF